MWSKTIYGTKMSWQVHQTPSRFFTCQSILADEPVAKKHLRLIEKKAKM